MNVKKNDFVELISSEATPSEEAFLNAFKSRIVGQPNAYEVATDAYTAMTNPLRDKTRPIGVYFLIGPSRTGKSYTGEVLAEILHGNKTALTRLQGADYGSEAQVLDLKGAPPMYVGYRDPDKQQLKPTDIDFSSVISNHNLNRVRVGSKVSVDIIVIEEFEKAHEDFYKLWMGVFDKGEMRLGNGKTVDFRNAIFIITSNLGMADLAKLHSNKIGFIQEKATVTEADVQNVVNKAIALHFKPEFLNRLDKIVIFKPLNEGETLQVVDSELTLVAERIAHNLSIERQFEFKCTVSAKSLLLAKAMENGGSVAELKRVINRMLVGPLGRELAKGSIGGGDLVRVSVQDGNFKFAIKHSSTSQGNLVNNVTNRTYPSVSATTYVLTLTGGDLEDLSSLLACLQHDLQAIYEIPWQKLKIDKESMQAQITVSATKIQISNLRTYYPELAIESLRQVCQQA